MFKFTSFDQEGKTLEAMFEYGGSFVKLLSTLYAHADPGNKMRLLNAFDDYFKQYLDGEINKGIPIKQVGSTATLEITVTDIDDNGLNTHGIHIEWTASDADLEHLFAHIIADPTNKVGDAIRKVVNIGPALTEEEARVLLGDNAIDFLKHKVEKREKETTEKLPN